MRCFVLPPDCAVVGRHALSGSNFHYLCRVRRYTVGSTFDATDGSGSFYRCTVAKMRRGRCDIEVAAAAQAEISGDSETARITLYQALPKGRKLEQIIRQATEAGTARIVPFSSRFCVAERTGGQRLQVKLDRWHSIAREAVQQSGRAIVPKIDEPISLEQIPPVGDPGEVGLLFHQQPLEQQSLHGYLRPGPQRVAIVIGAEGGFSPAEVEFMCNRRGYRSVHLGPAVLRTETAALYALAAVQTILREISAWSRS